jgi:hypothetical protein
VLRRKEQELLVVKKEIDALRITVRLLSDENLAVPPDQKVDLRQAVELGIKRFPLCVFVPS